MSLLDFMKKSRSAEGLRHGNLAPHANSAKLTRRMVKESQGTVMPRTRLLLCLLMSLLSLLALIPPRLSFASAILPTGFAESLFINNLPYSTTMMKFSPDGRLFVAEQAGKLWVVKNSQLLSTPFLTVVTNTLEERGLNGIAFDPDFVLNGYVYIYYTATSPTIHNRVSRFTANGDIAVAGSETVIFEIDDLGTWGYHNGGSLGLGADGMLYIATGENNSPTNAQSMTTRKGKILRINKDGTIPQDNPFYSICSINRGWRAAGMGRRIAASAA